MLAELVDERRRRILAILLGRDETVDEAALAERLLAAERETSAEDVTAEDARPVRIELRHAHLPTLAGAGLVRWDETDATVAAADHPALEDPAIRRVIETDAEDWDAVVAGLAHERRRAALGVLAERDGATPRFTLAREIAALEADGEPSPDAIDEVRLSLHHVHLSKLRDAGLIEYDRDAETVTFVGHPDLEPSFFADRSDEPPRDGGHWLARCLG